MDQLYTYSDKKFCQSKKSSYFCTDLGRVNKQSSRDQVAAIFKQKTNNKMAKVTKMIGNIRGRVGGLVYSKGEGAENYVRAYQPQVLNPKTEGQVDQRAKMNLVGRLSEVTPKAVLVGMGGSGRMRRSAFNANLLNMATIDRSTPGTIVAQLEPEDIVFSRGAEAMSANLSTPAAVTDTQVSLGLTLADSSLAGKYGERIVVAVIDPEDKGGYSFLRTTEVVLNNTTAVTITVPFGTTIANQTMVAVYRLPFVLTEEGQSMVTEGISNDATNIVAKAIMTAGALRGWGNSKMESKQVFTRA